MRKVAILMIEGDKTFKEDIHQDLSPLNRTIIREEITAVMK